MQLDAADTDRRTYGDRYRHIFWHAKGREMRRGRVMVRKKTGFNTDMYPRRRRYIVINVKNCSLYTS